MIANKHTELRIYSNLNSLLEDALDKQEYKKKVQSNITNYIREYIDNNTWNKNIYDVFEELSSSYQKHCYNIARRIEEEIFEEKQETNYLDPNVYTEDFRETLREELTDKVVQVYFKELNNQLNIYEYKNKIDKLRKKDKTSMFEEKKYEIQQLIEERIERYYNIYRNRGYSPSLVLKNMETNKEFKDEITQNSLYGVHDLLELDDTIKTLDNKIIQLSEKCRKDFIRNERTKLGITNKSNKVQVEVPRYVKAYAISKIFKDMTKW